MADFLWTYRFLYRDLNDLLARNRTLETHFKQIITHKVHFASQLCEALVADQEMVATPAEIKVIATNIGVIATYWLSYQYVMNPRKYNDQEAIRAELHQASLHIISVMAPYLRGRSRELFDDLASGKMPMREYADFLPPRDDTVPKTETLARIHDDQGGLCVLRLLERSQTCLCRSREGVRPCAGGSGHVARLWRRTRRADGAHRR